MSAGTRDRLVAAAMQLFWQKGYGSTSMADVLQLAGVNSGSLYHFFPGKQDLLLAVLARYREGLHPMLLDPPGPASTIRSSVCSRCLTAIARASSTPTAPTAAPSAASRWRSTSPIRPCASRWPRTSRPGPMRSRSVSKRPAATAGEARSPGARGLRADGDGRRRHAGPHPSRRELFRWLAAPVARATSTGSKRKPRLFGRAARGRKAVAHGATNTAARHAGSVKAPSPGAAPLISQRPRIRPIP